MSMAPAKPQGFLIPSWYKSESVPGMDLGITSVIWGFTLSTATFTATKAVSQSYRASTRGKLYCAYIVMVWAEWIVCVTMSVLSWMYLIPDITSVGPGFWTFFVLLVLWVVQIQCILQIIINRVRLLMADERRAEHMKWAVAIFVGLINISVFIIWLPARLQISERWITINMYWDRVEKVLFALLDIGLNLYFVYLVRSNLISKGLKKYWILFWFNMMMIFISLSLDIILIGVMSLPNSAVYIQFHPLVYLVKLHIEMNISDLIVKIVKSKNKLNDYKTQKEEATSSLPTSSTVATSSVHQRTKLLDQPSERPEATEPDDDKMTSVQTVSERSSDIEAGQ